MLKRLLRTPAVNALLAAVLGRYLAFALRTTRWTLHGAEHVASHMAGAPAIAAFWHERLPVMPALWRIARTDARVAPTHVLVSRHTDGRLIGDLVRRFDLHVLHGSTARGGRDRGGAAGLRHMLERLQHGDNVALTPDGPRGPRRICAPGVAQLAAMSGCRILPCGAATTHARGLRSWDQMRIPFPIGRGALVCGAPISVSRDDWQSALPLVTAALNGAMERAAQLL